MRITRIDTRRDDVEQSLDSLRQRLSPRGDVVSDAGRRKTIEVFGEPLGPQQVVERICGEIRDHGWDALTRYSLALDGEGVTRQSVLVPVSKLAQAHAQADPAFLATIRRIRDNIWEFQRAILHDEVEIARQPGVRLRQCYWPLHRVGICVPGGAAAYPSTVLMTAVPAFAAGVQEIAVVAPPTRFGSDNPDVLATCQELGIHEVYRLGGAQGVAALAYGVDGLPRVDKIVGPGNLFVALAKRLVFGEVAIDSIAGPSEVVVLADDTTRPDYAASDLLAQAEHSPGASILISWSESLLDRTWTELHRQVATLSRAELTIQSLESYGAFILVRDEQEACAVTNQIAPEHLHVAIDNGGRLLPHLDKAGATFVGHYSPVALGDYIAGPSHVLPTGGTARWASGLTANDFRRSGAVIEYAREALQAVADDVCRMADKEGLTAHRASVDVRG